VRIGLVSDTHDLLRPEVLEYLRGSDHIVHAGDICGEAVLAQLALLAPLTVVRGNNDQGPWARQLREREVLQLGGATCWWSTTSRTWGAHRMSATPARWSPGIRTCRPWSSATACCT
jgi:putative phosphoesterase